MRLVFFGTSDFAVPSLRAVAAAGHRVAAVVTQPDRPAGRGRRLVASPVKEAAMELGLPVLQPERASSPDTVTALTRLAPDLFAVAAYGQILSPALLAVPRLGAVNVHASLLPRWRGAAPVQRAIMAGDRETGISIMWMTPALDAGDIILQSRTPIAPYETAGEVLARLAGCGAESLVRALDLIAQGRAPRQAQDPAGVTLAPALRKEERVIPWTDSAQAIVNRVRALAPRPGAVTTLEGVPLRALQASVVDFPGGKGEPGTIAEVQKQGIIVCTGHGFVALEQVQAGGGKVLSAWDYARGHRVLPGGVLR